MAATSQQSVDNDFKKAFDVFREEQIRCLRERTTQMSRQRANQARLQGIKGNVDPHSGRFSAYQSLTKNIGDDFVANVENILIPNCGEISAENIQTVTQELQRIFLAQLEQARQAETRFAVSIGRPEEAKPMILSVEGHFLSTLGSYRDKVSSLIKQSNLTKARQSSEKMPEKSNATESVFTWFKSKPVFAFLIVLSMIVVGLATFTNALRDIGSFLQDIFSSPIVERSLSSQELETEVNARFGFSFSYPKTWDRSDPANADGNSYSDPKEPRVTFSAWGGFAVVTHSLDDWVSFTLRTAETKPGFRLVLDRESGRHLVGWDTLGAGLIETRQPIEGRRIVYEIRESSETYRIMQVFTQSDDIQFSLQCRAPSKLFPIYEDLFLTLVSSLRVLSKEADSLKLN